LDRNTKARIQAALAALIKGRTSEISTSPAEGGLTAMNEDDPEYWPTQLQEIFAAIGAAMGDKRLTPETLKSVHMPSDEFAISHVRGDEVGRKHGHYKISMTGGQWAFQSGRLEKLSRAAAKSKIQTTPLPKLN
jgi:hypothetical protein